MFEKHISSYRMNSFSKKTHDNKSEIKSESSKNTHMDAAMTDETSRTTGLDKNQSSWRRNMDMQVCFGLI